MANSLEELWENRLANQKFPLIGTNKPGEGNGFHDRLSFDVPYHLLNRDYEPRYSNWIYSVYFRDLVNFLNPQYNRDRGETFQNAIQLENCSGNFRDTFFKYLDTSDRWRNDGILEILGRWGNHLIHHGRVIIEFIGWYDNETQDLYAYELKQINLSNCTIKKNHVLFSAPVQEESETIRNVTVEIPKSKCIIIEWPKELGGYNSYKETVNSVLQMGNKYGTMEETALMNPGESVKKMKDWDLKFHSLTSKWGATHPLDNTTEFYKQYNFFKLKETIVYCSCALIDGLKQLISLLNEKLDEEAILTFDYKEADINKVQEMKSKWLAGKLSFQESSKVLTFH